MKKFLSLVLVMTMVLSLFTMTTMASATDFTDDESITYQEAIDVISAIGVVTGYSDGSFKPTQPLTRGAAAKIITNLILGPSTASQLVCTVAPFPDVPANHTFAAAITYCSQNKIINGYGNGNFVPDGTLTGFAFLKMLLGALGYDGTIEGFTGPNWSINVAKLADGIGLTDKVAEGFSGTGAVDRQTACLFAFNTIKSDLVEYDNRITANVGGVDVSIGGNNTAKSVQWQTQATRSNNITNDTIVQFGERYFSRLVRNGGDYHWDDSYEPGAKNGLKRDSMGRPAVKWEFRGESIGTYTEDPVLTYNGSVKITDIYNDLKLSSTADGWLYMNGVLVDGAYKETTCEDGFVEVKRANDTKLSDLSKIYIDDETENIGDGTIVEVFYNDRTNEVIIAAQSLYGGKVATVKGESAKKDAYVTIDGGDTYPVGFYDKDERCQYETTEFKVDDVVAYTYSDADDCIVSMYKMESVEGSLAKYTVSKNLTLGETTYKYAQELTFGDGMSDGEGSFSNGSNYIVYLDSNGYALWIEEAEFSASSYALVLRITSQEDGKNSQVYGWGWLDAEDSKEGVAGYQDLANSIDGQTGAWDGNRARLLLADGTTRTVDLDKPYLNNGKTAIDPNFRAGKVVRFRVADNGAYKLTSAKGSTNTAEVVGSFEINDKHEVKGFGSDMEFDNNTVFVVNDNGSYKIYTGRRNAPKIEGGDAFVYFTNDGSTKVARVVFVTDGSVVGNSKDVTFLAKESASKLIDQTDGDSYYTYNAVVKGEITTIKVNADQDQRTINGELTDSKLVTDGNTPGKLKTDLVLNQTSYDNDDNLVFGYYSGTAPKRAEGLKKQSGNDIRVDTWNGENNSGRGSLLTIASGTKVFYVDDGGDIEQIEISDIATDPNVDVVYTLNSDSDIDNIFIIEVDRK